MGTPDHFAAKLGGQLKVNADYVKWKPSKEALGLLNLESKPADPGTLNFESLLDLFVAWLQEHKGPAPVIIIDEANRLYAWKDLPALAALMRFLVLVTTEKHMCHVVLATWSDFVFSWLQNQGVRQGQYIAYTLGDLPGPEAKAFVFGEGAKWPGLLQECSAEGFTLPESLWPELYQVAGGNMQALGVVCSDASLWFTVDWEMSRKGDVEKTWKEAFQRRRIEAAAIVANGFKPSSLVSSLDGERPLWTPQQWGSVLNAIATADNNAVPVPHIKALLGGGDVQAGSRILDSLLRYHMVDYRQPSPLAFDLPESVYGEAGDVPVVTATSAAALEYIKKDKWRSTYKRYCPPKQHEH